MPSAMTSHGIARAAKFRTEDQRQKDLGRIENYRSLEEQLRRRVAIGEYGAATFQLTSKLLRINPEYYTVWNIRRRSLISGSLSGPSHGSLPSMVLPSSSASATHTSCSDGLCLSSSTETPQDHVCQTTGRTGTAHDTTSDTEVIRSELRFTVPLLQESPKCYWIWNYRMWILDQATRILDVNAARKIWEEELGLVSKMLQKDGRNFHAWTYRRFVVAQLESAALAGKSMAEAEFKYTTAMINHDLSNFSAWHNRSRLIPVLLCERKAGHDARKLFFESELDWIRKALDVGADDQSLWYYHKFLVFNLVDSSERESIIPRLPTAERQEYIRSEIADIKELLEDFPESKLIYEALIDYTLAFARLGEQGLLHPQATEVKQWLEKLKQLDPKRRGRWLDLDERTTVLI